LLIEQDHEFMLSRYYPKMQIEPLNIGYATLPRKRKALELEKDFFENFIFVFYSNLCYWGTPEGKSDRVFKCSSEQYLDHDKIRENFTVEKETCFEKHCITLFHKKI